MTEREATWGGPRQFLTFTNLSETSQYRLEFLVQTSALISLKVKLHVKAGSEEKYLGLFSSELTAPEWETRQALVNINQMVAAADSVDLYFEGSPASTDFSLDNVSLREFTPDLSWKHQADQRIETLRKREVSFEFVDIAGSALSLDIKQTNHLFPFGQAVKSSIIASCYDEMGAAAENIKNYCSFVSQNFNWIVDTYRMKWRPIEPTRGQFEVEIPTKMISWANQNNLTVRGEPIKLTNSYKNYAEHSQVILFCGRRQPTILIGSWV